MDWIEDGIAEAHETLDGRLSEADLNATYVSTLIAKGPGIDPTGATDSTTALQALVDSAATVGAAVSFPPGVYRINSLTLGPLTRLISLGGGTTRFSSGGVTKPLVIFKHQTSSVLPMVIINGGGVVLENIEMQGNFSTAPLLHVENGFESTLRNVRMISVSGTAFTVKRANNTKWYDVFVDNCGSSTAAAVIIKSPTTAEGNETNTLDIHGLSIERSQNVALDIAYGGTKTDGFYAEFVRISNLHVESANDNGGVSNVDPLIRIGNVRHLVLVNPFIYGGPGYLIEHASGGTMTTRLKEGVFIVGGALLGDETDATTHLVHLVSGDDFALVGVRAGRFVTSAVKVESSYGAKVKIDPTSSLDGTTSTWLTDARTGYVVPQANKSIGGTGTTGVTGGTVTTLTSAGATRNVLDDGTGGMTASGALVAAGGLRLINRTVTATGGLTTADIVVVSTASSAITLTLPASSTSFMWIKNAGTAILTLTAPSSGSAPAIDGVASLALTPGEQVLVSGRSSSVGTWSVLSRDSTKSLVGTPTLVTGANAGAGAPAATLVAGSNDRRGTIQIGTGTSPAAGVLVSVTFGRPYPVAPFVAPSVQAQNGTGPFVKDVTATGFNIGLLAAPAASQSLGTYALGYVVND
ncbi:hypothetical protein ACH47B_06535 [Rhodococcus sp. NPDC019627]|uniref:hypothetical protein n=1 Tax=unclassified Rhodococcus (in: high G+C Gram-positive bacteria) TaxID=192944 RepID=UPI0037A61D16